MKKLFLLQAAILLFCSVTKIHAQLQPKNCLTDLLHERLKNANPERGIREQQINQLVYDNIRNGNVQRGGELTIPVVIHIIHQNGAENISDAMVMQGLQHLNEAFSNTGNYLQPTGVNTHIQFCLAHQDEMGMATTGITRHVSELTNVNSETQDVELKSIVQWDPFNYLNIYLVREITSTSMGNGIAGYAYYPSSHGSPEDGIVNEAGLFGSSVDNSKVHVHEAGHYLGLYHTFNSGCTNANCLMDGDRVCDTPPDNSTDPVQCNSATNTCTSDSDDPTAQNPFRPVGSGGLGDQPDMFVNYMDYGFQLCQHSFTQGQGDRMSEMLNGPRASLLSSEGCNNACGVTATGINPPYSVLFPGMFADLAGYSLGNVPHHFEWLVNGVTVGSDSTFHFAGYNAGNYVITFRIYNNEQNCFSEQAAQIEVRCGTQLGPVISSEYNPQPGETVTYYGQGSMTAFSSTWLVNGVVAGSSPILNYVFDEAGESNVVYITSNGICSDTSQVIYVPVGSCNKGEGLKWFFGTASTLTFYDNTPVVGYLSTIYPIYSNEGGSSICDLNGNLLLLTNGDAVFNGSGDTLANGTGLLGGNSSAQNALIIPNPSYNGLYYIFTTDHFGGIVAPNGGGLSYNIADTDQDSVIQKNILLVPATTEKQAAVRHCNGHDIWHVSKEYGTNAFYAYLVTDEGVNPVPVISHIGEVITPEPFGSDAMGCMKLSPQGDKLAHTIYGQAGDVLSHSELLDFDNATGMLSNPVNLPSDPTHRFPYGIEFSPDGTKLYVSNSDYEQVDDIVQYDLSSGNPTEIVASKQIIVNTHAGGNGNGSLQLAKNGRIYSVRSGDSHLDEIREPNLAGQACQFVLNAVSGIFTGYGLPNQVASLVADLTPNIHGPAQLCSNSTGTYSIVCGNADNTTWTYSGSGTFQQLDESTALINAGVNPGSGQLIVTRDAGCDGILRDTVFIRIGLPEPALGNDTLICATGEVHLSPGTGYSSYLWQNGTNMSYLNAQGPGTYWVKVTGEGGCISSDTIHVSAFNEPLTVSLGNNVLLCQGASTILSPEETDYAEYSWSTGDTIPSITVNYTGDFVLEVTSTNGCKAYDTVNVSPNYSNNFFLFTDPQYLCPGEVLVLETPYPELQHRWQDHSDLPEFTAWQPGHYWVTITSACGYDYTDSVTVLEGSSPTLELGEDTLVCPFTPFNLVASPGASHYLWNDGSQLQTFLVTGSGNYSVTVTNAQGCSRSDSIKVDACSLGINEQAPGIVIYPNPAGDFLNIKGGTGENFSIRLYTSAGQLLAEKEINGNAIISTEGFADGIYVLEIRAGNKVYHQKVILNH